MHEVTIRRAVAADLAAVVALLEDVDDMHRNALPWLFRRIDGAPLTDFLEPYVSKEDHAMFLAVAPDGALAGVLYMFLRQPARAPIVKPTLVAEIDSLVVSGAFRRQHIGKRLVEAAINWANACGATRTELGVYEFNEPARSFWASVGFETLSRRLVLHAKSSVDVVMAADQERSCDECGSSYFSSSSQMAQLCAECAHLLYGYPACPHRLVDGRCANCGWDGSRSQFLRGQGR